MTISSGSSILASDIQAIKDDVDAVVSTGTSEVTTSQSTTSTSPTDLTTPGPSVTITTGTKALVIITCRLRNSTAGATATAGVEVSGATTIAAGTAGNDMQWTPGNSNDAFQGSVVIPVYTLTAGSNTFTMKYSVSAGTGAFNNRRITVIPIGA